MRTPARATKTPSSRSRTSATATGASDDDRARDLILWCRAQKVHIGRVRVGDVELDGVVDLTRITAPDDGAIAPRASDLRQEYGAAALDRLAKDLARDRAVNEVTLPASLDG